MSINIQKTIGNRTRDLPVCNGCASTSGATACPQQMHISVLKYVLNIVFVLHVSATHVAMLRGCVMKEGYIEG